MRKLSTVALRILASRKFFYFIVGLLVFQAVWIALSFSYPLLWDEYYHFGLAQFYAHHLNPIITNQPHSLDMYGNVARSPKYLYHYLISFPLRGISLITANEMAQVIMLRLLNIAIFAGGLIAFRQALLRMVRSKALVHLVLLVFVLFPMTPLLAAHINYDNLQFLLTGLVLYWTFRFVQARRFESSWLLAIIGTGAVACVVKQTFLPVYVAILGYLFIYSWRKWGLGSTFKAWWKDYNQLGKWTKIGLTVLVVVGIGLCVERFGINMVRYHALEPACSKVLTEERCLNFSPFKQEQLLAQRTKAEGWQLYGPVGFTYHKWLHDIYIQYFETGTQIEYEVFEVPPVLHIPLVTMLAVSAVTLVSLAVTARQLCKRREVQIVLLASIVLAAALWLVDYEKYRRTGFPIAIQGRYLVPIVLPAMMVGAMAVRQAVPWRKVRVGLAAAVIIGMVWGGGLITHITLSESSWYWQNRVVIDINDDARKILAPITF